MEVMETRSEFKWSWEESIAELEAQVELAREALESMRGIYENQQLSTASVSSKMLAVALNAIEALDRWK